MKVGGADKLKPPKRDDPVDPPDDPVDPPDDPIDPPDDPIDPPDDPIDPPTVPAPGVVAAVACTSGDMVDSVSFEPPTDGGPIASYTLLRAASFEGPFSVVATTGPDTGAFALAVEQTGAAYYAVAASGPGGDGPMSAAVSNSRVSMTVEVTPAGRTLRSSNGEVALTLAPGSFSEPTSVSIVEVAGFPTGPFLSLAGLYRVEPSGALGAPATLSIAYTLSVTHYQVAETLLRAANLMTRDEVSGVWVPGASSVRAAGGYLTGDITHFSDWFPGTFQPHGTSPEATDYCSGVCHNLTAEPNSAIRLEARDPQVCYICHGNTDEDLAPAGATGANVQAEFFAITGQARPVDATTHPVTAAGMYCSSCHDPHKNPAANPKMLRSYDAVTGTAVTGGNGFCWTCHGVTRNRRINLLVPNYYTRTGGDKKTHLAGTGHASLSPPEGEIVCLACHLSHGSGANSLVTTATIDGSAVTGNDQSLCRACHEATLGAYPGQGLYTVTKHSTVTESAVAATSWPDSRSAAGSCQNCHDPHGTANPDYLRSSGATLCLVCHDAAGVSYPSNYSYRGAARFGLSGHSGVTGGPGYVGLNPSSDGFAVWESDVQPTPGSPGQLISDQARLDALSVQDGSRLRTAIQATTGSTDYQMFRFKSPVAESGVVSGSLLWAGYGELTPGYPVTLSIWQPDTSSWTQLRTGAMPTQQVVTVPIDPSLNVDENGYVYVLAQAMHVVDGEIVSGPTFTKLSDTSIRVDWQTAGITSTEVVYGLTDAYGSTATGAAGTNHSVTISDLAAGAWHFSARSYSPDPLAAESEDYIGADYVFGFPRPQLIAPSSTSQFWGGTPVPVTFSWQAMAGPNPFTYTFKLYQNDVLVEDVSQAGTSYDTTLSAPGYWTWRVRAVDSVTGLDYGWSETRAYNLWEGSSCPFVFVWDGETFAFEADISTTGKLAEKTSTGYSRPDPRDRYKLTTEPQVTAGSIEIRLVEERREIDYTDEFRLYAIDLPEGVDVFAEKGVRGGPGPVPPDGLHTVTDLRTPSVVRLDTGQDVTALVASDDESYLVLNEDREDFEYKTLEVDLGPEAVSAPQVKIVMDAQTARPLTPEGVALQRTYSKTTVLEVQNLDGTWRTVPSSEATLPNAMEFARSFVFDIGPAMHDTTGRVRFTFLFKTYIDMLAVDTSADLPLEITELPLESADLTFHGIDERTNEGEIYDFVYGALAGEYTFPPGRYTKYGDVTPLLTTTDDKFVIWGPGDEIVMRFKPAPASAGGTHREYVTFIESYYKSRKSDTEFVVEPLPFAAMSNFPYGADEHYPDDIEHREYLAEWNTRVVGEAITLEPPSTLASLVSRLWESVAAALAKFAAVSDESAVAGEAYPVEHRSLNTDVIALDLVVSEAAAGGECGLCHNVHGATEDGQLLAGGRAASDGRTCTADGTGGCHDNAANSASGIDIRAAFTSGTSPLARHDVFTADQRQTGARIACADCHNPHTDNAVGRYSDPDAISIKPASPLESLIGNDGSMFVLIGAAHDGTPPTISAPEVSGTVDWTNPTVSWMTNEPATTWIDWGLTTSYEGGTSGNDLLVTSHAVNFPAATPGATYHFRIRTADALGNEQVSEDHVYDAYAPPAAPVLIPALDTEYSGGLGVSYTFVWSAVTSPDGDPVEYQVVIDDAPMAWQSTDTSATYTIFGGNHSWTVRARDAVHTTAVGAFAPRDYFTVVDTSGSCPFLFVWDGEAFSFEADLNTTGMLASKNPTGYFKPDPRDRYVLKADPALADDEYELRIVEERHEVDYTDEFKLYAVDLPAGVDLYAEKGERGKITPLPPGGLHTVSDLRPPVSALRTDTGEDVTVELSDDDGTYVQLNEDSNVGFDYKTLEIDLGDVSGAPQVKIVMDAESQRPNTAEGLARQRTFDEHTILEVQDTSGAWRRVPATEATLPNAMEFARSYVFDIGPAMHDTTGKVRFTFLFKTYIDMIRVDTSEDLPIEITELPLSSAELSYHGLDTHSNPGEIYTYLYGVPGGSHDFPTGSYTRYGDVTPLLAATDDMFVIWGPGDELALRFAPIAEPATGTHREYVTFIDGYYKSPKSAVELKVEPLPFAAMSNYPYGADEEYPDDLEHREYLTEWNTRVWGGSAEAISATSPGVVWRPFHVQSASAVEDAYSVDTDLIAVRTVSATGAATVNAAAGWESESASASKPAPSVPGSAVGGTKLSDAASSNDVRWRTAVAAAEGDWNWQLVRFDLGADALQTVKGLVLQWEGHGEPTPSHPTAIFVWNPGTSAWIQLDSRQMVTDTALSFAHGSVADSFCLRCHDGAAPGGVTLPVGSVNIAAKWNSDTGDFHGAGSGTGFGSTGLKAPYVRGQAQLPCGTCHDAHGTSSIYHVPSMVNGEPISPVGDGTQMAALCRTCHLGTAYEWHDNPYGACWCHYPPYDHDYAFLFTDTNMDCLDCHKHGTNYQHVGQRCSGCHGHPSSTRAF